MFQGIDELEGANGVGARTEEILARNAAGTKPRKAREKPECLKRDGRWGCRKRGEC